VTSIRENKSEKENLCCKNLLDFKYIGDGNGNKESVIPFENSKNNVK